MGPLVILTLGFAAGARAQAPDTASGPRVRSVYLRGNETTKPEVILREMVLRPGGTVTAEALEHDRERIYNLQIFNKVDVDAHELGDSADVYVTVNERWYVYPYPVIGFRHRDTRKLFYGVGGTHQNVAGLNQKLYFEAVTGYDKWFNVSYQNPRFAGSQDTYFRAQAGGFLQHPLSRDGGTEYEQRVGIARIGVGQRYGFYRTLVLDIGVEYWRVPFDGAVRRTASTTGKDLLFTAQMSWSDDRRDLREYPTDGTFLSLAVAKDGLGEGDVDILRFQGDYRRYDPLVGPWVIGTRAYTRLTTGGYVPAYRHVFYGYDERLRGSFGTVREGELQAGGNVELRVPLLSPRYYEAEFIPMRQFSVLRYGIYAAVFADGGKIWYRNRSFKDAPLIGGAGFGLHFILPYSIVVRTEAALDRSGRGEFVIDFGASF